MTYTTQPTTGNDEQVSPRGLRIFTKIVAASTVFLIFAGAMVTSTGSGLAVPDWPLSYGMLFPPMVGGIFYEHGHRMIAATVGFLTVIQALWLQLREPKRWLRKMGWAALAAVVAQGLLGGLTVIFLLPPAISVAHAALAELFLCTSIAIAFFTSKLFGRLVRSGAQYEPSRVSRLAVILPVFTFVQVLLGAVMRHLQAGLAIPDFPLSFGKLVPAFTSFAVVVNYAHRTWAFVVAAIAISLAVRLIGRQNAPPSRLLGSSLVFLVLLQITLGAWTVWSVKQPHITSLHVMVGATFLALTVLTALVERTRTRAGRLEASGVLAGRSVTA